MNNCTSHETISREIGEIKTELAVIRRDLEHIINRFSQHVDEAERNGGWRDKMVFVEADLKLIRVRLESDRITTRWMMIGSGIIGGLIGSQCVDVITSFLGLFK
jgi:hypothetical protein